ncbi:hypothetical protein ACTXT7_001250 [Hymenolepis weldensis]
MSSPESRIDYFLSTRVKQLAFIPRALDHRSLDFYAHIEALITAIPLFELNIIFLLLSGVGVVAAL